MMDINWWMLKGKKEGINRKEGWMNKNKNENR